MILADTSIWIDHFRAPNPILFALVEQQVLVMHPLVIGEIAMGSIARRVTTLNWLSRIERVPEARHDEVLDLVADHQLFASGIGYVDAHLLASALLGDGVRVWTRDGRLAAVAGRLGVGPPTTVI